MTTSPAEFDSPSAAIDAIVRRLSPLGRERVPLEVSSGRVLGEPVDADRDSPPSDVSAMDGFAVRVEDLTIGQLPVTGEVTIGRAPPRFVPASAMRIVTGGGVPDGANAILKREDVHESDGVIDVPRDVAERTKPGSFIRFAGENVSAGNRVLDQGTLIGAPVAGTLASFGVAHPLVTKRVLVSVLSTGDEVLPPDSSPDRWQLRDSNAASLRAMLAPVPWIELVQVRHVPDERDLLFPSVRDALERSDAIFLTGGVSMGHRDFVPEAIRRNGGDVVFHRLPQKPGKPILGAVGPDGQPILALPGNPVSVLVTARRFGAPVLGALAGRTPAPAPLVQLAKPDHATLPLWWYRLVRRDDAGRYERVGGLSSGDVRSPAIADGFIETPPDRPADGPAPFYAWAWD